MLKQNKQDLRIWAKEKRKNLDIISISHQLVNKLQNTDEYKQANNIMMFYPLKNEINLLELLKDKAKNFYLPKIKNNNLLCCSYKEGDMLCESCFKTQEPVNNPVNESIIDLVLVPALAVDKENYRLGYGGGYYDRFLQKLNVKTIVCIPKELILESVFPEIHDIKIDKILSI